MEIFRIEATSRLMMRTKFAISGGRSTQSVAAAFIARTAVWIQVDGYGWHVHVLVRQSLPVYNRCRSLRVLDCVPYADWQMAVWCQVRFAEILRER